MTTDTLVFQSYESAVDETRRTPDGEGRGVRMYFGGTTNLRFGPQAFLVYFPSGQIGKAHFHPVDQFQLYFGGSGETFQRREYGPLMLLYTDAHVTYGPFAPGNGEMQFVALRAEPTDVTGYMPGSRHLLPERIGKRRNIHRNIDLQPRDDLANVKTVFEKQEDGLGAWIVRGPAHGSVTIPSSEASSGQYIYVMAGELELGHQSFGPRSLGWNPADVGEQVVRVGPDDCTLLIMQFPWPASNALSSS